MLCVVNLHFNHKFLKLQMKSEHLIITLFFWEKHGQLTQQIYSEIILEFINNVHVFFCRTAAENVFFAH